MKIFSLLLLSISFFSFDLYSTEAKVGYGSSNAVYPAKNQEFFYMGFSLGFDAQNLKNNVKVDTMQITDSKALGAVRSATNLIKRNKNLLSLVGFPTSHEALLASKVAVKNNVLFLSAAGSHSKLAELGNSVFTLGEALQSSQKALLGYLNKTKPKKPGLVVNNSKATFSVNQDRLIKQASKKYNEVSLDSVSINKRKELPKNIITKLKNDEFSFIILTTYADDSTLIFKQLVANNINIPIYTNPSWIVGDIDFVKRLMISYPGKILCISSVIKGVESAKDFEKKALKAYDSPPTTEMYYGYDTGAIVAETISRIKGPLSAEAFKKAFHENLCFKNTTAGTLCFPKKGGHAFRDVYVLKFSKKMGFIPKTKILDDGPL